MNEEAKSKAAQSDINATSKALQSLGAETAWLGGSLAQWEMLRKHLICLLTMRPTFCTLRG